VTEWTPFWQPKGTVSVSGLKVAKVENRAPNALYCEFVGDEIDPVCEGGYCSNGTFCPASCFKDPLVFAKCTFYLEKLKEKKPL